MDEDGRRDYFLRCRKCRARMSDQQHNSTLTFAVWANVFFPAGLDQIEAYVHRVTVCTKGTRTAIVAWTTGPKLR